VVVAYTDGLGQRETLTSAPSQAVANSPDPAIWDTTRQITGETKQGATLRVDTRGISDGDGVGAFSYQWQQAQASNTNTWETIAGATSTTLILTQAQVGKVIRSVVNFKDGSGNDENVTSQPTAAIANVNDAPSGFITIDGTATKGETLTANTTKLSDADGLGRFSYQWEADGINIAEATSKEFILSQAQVGKVVSVVVSYTDAGGAAESVRAAASRPVSNSNKAPTGGVSLSGTATQGQELTADTSALLDEDGLGAFSYQWKADGINIADATSKEFTLTQAQAGKIVSAVVSYTDLKGTVEDVASNQTTAVADINDIPAGEIEISGLPTEGATLRAITGSINDPDGAPTLSNAGNTLQFKWKADDSAISGAISDSYNLTQADVGKAISVEVAYTDNGGFRNTISSSPTAKIVNINDSPTGAVTVSGSAQQGQILAADTSGLSDLDGIAGVAFSYQWLANGSPISAATDKTFTPTQAEVGKRVAVVIAYKDNQGTPESLRSAATTAIENTNDAPSGLLTIKGNPEQGQTLTADTSALTDADGLGTSISYQWKADSDTISGATSKTLPLGQAQVGKTISVVATYTDGQGTPESVTSIKTTAVSNLNDKPSGLPVIRGQLAQTLQLTADTSSISDADGLGAFSYQWKADGSNIVNATSETFSLTQAEVGKRISVVVSYIDGQGTSESLTSSQSKPVGSADSLLSGSVRVDSNGAPIAQGNQLRADTSSSPIQLNGNPLSQLNYQWYANGVAISGATTDRFTPTQPQVGQLISVEIIDPTSGASRSSDPSSPVINSNDAPTGLAATSGLLNSLPQENATLSIDPTPIRDADGRSSSPSYQWTIDGVRITAANQASFTPTDEHVGRQLAVQISYTDDFGSQEIVTQTVGHVVAVNDASTGSLSLAGFLLADQPLSILDTLADPDGLTTRTYTWERSSDGGTSWATITTQSDPKAAGYGTYQLSKTADAGAQIRVVASYIDQQGFTETIRSQATGRVIGQFSEGRQISYASSDPLALLQWQIRSSSLANWTDLPGETSDSLRTENNWGGQAVRLKINGAPLPELAIAAIDSGVGVLPPLSSDGPLEIGVTLTAGLPLDDPDGLNLNQANLQVQWQRFSSVANAWLAISGATSSSYKTVPADTDQSIRAVLTYTDAQNFSNTLYSNSLKPRLVAPPTPEGLFNPIASDDVLTAAEYAIASNFEISLRGTVTNNTARNTSVSLGFGGQIRQASVSDPDNLGVSTWSYALTENDQRFLLPGSANAITATLTQTLNSQVGTTLITRSLAIGSDVALPGVNPNSASDPTQSDGIKQEVKTAAADALVSLGELAKRIGQPNVAAAPLGSGSAFQQGADAPADSYGLFEVPGDTSAAGIDTYTASSGAYGIPNTSGGIDQIATPEASSFKSVTDPIALTIKDVEPGATITFKFILPQDSADLLPSNLSQARYFKLDNIKDEFVNFLDSNGNPYYSYSLTDQNNNGLRDPGESVTLTLQLTDGDLRWDRDGIANGIIVDPGTFGANVNDSPTGSVSISGTPTKGQTLSASNTLADLDGIPSSGPGSITYQWLAAGNPISGATSSTYLLSQRDVGQSISVTASYTDQQGTNESVTSEATAAVANVNESTPVTTINAPNITFISPPVLVATDDAVKQNSESYIKLVAGAQAVLAEGAINFVSATQEPGGSIRLGLNLNTFFASGTTFIPNTRLSYYSITPDPKKPGDGEIKTLTYDPIKRGGARFYDRDGDRRPDFVHLSLIDGDYGDKDGVANGVIDDPSTVGTSDLDLELRINGRSILKALDPKNATAPATASVVLRASLERLSSTANQIGYVVFKNDEEANNAGTLGLDTIRRQSKTLFTTLENSDVVLPGSTTFDAEILLLNNQNVRFFEVVDGTLDQLNNDNYQSRLHFLSGTQSQFNNKSVQFSSSSGISFILNLQDANQGLSALIGQEQGTAAVLDFTSFSPGETVRGTLHMGREADYDSVTGFYRTLDATGAVRNALGDVLHPGEVGYSTAALRTENRVDALSGLTIGDNQTSSRAIELRETSFIAPFAQVNGNTFFAFAAANIDKISHFRVLGTNMFGLEDTLGGGDLDFDDNVLVFKFNSVI
jgi:hypothetical protein